MAKRKAVGNKLRFEVFKRDSFKCQYCGRSAPDVILNVDHLHPHAKGGDANILNLVTSCFECNSGKSDRMLMDNSVVAIQKKQLDDLNERRMQIEMMIEWKTQMSNHSTYECDAIIKYFNNKNVCEMSLTDFGKKEVSNLLKKYSITQIISGIDQAFDRYYSEIPTAEMWDKIPRVLNFMYASDNDKNKMKFFGGIKKRFENTSGYNKWQTVATNNVIRSLYDIIDSDKTNLEYKDLFRVLNANYSYNSFVKDIDRLYTNYSEYL
jgi:hypothetical protein